jgi:hypothetical protein
MPKITGTYAMQDWQEEPYRDEPVPLKLTRVHAHGDVSGGVTGIGPSFFLIAYIGGTGPYTGYTQFTGTLGGVDGSFVMADDGIFDPEAATSRWTIVEGSGTGGLAGITGTGGFRATHGLTVSFTLDYELAR